ncbi:TonB-dependent receptor [Pedobacter sandarakinus]|uniref:TonB-dependent receptor n=1 Tax=Pedobacter sandarakinus TaxID=353156 RepID=UPI002247A2EC|nr:TonB-dependent receptor [Pedobacter sandarakinus]MCX2575092.1 TonB-dependent receptor [Pedobacter sandarakinus]
MKIFSPRNYSQNKELKGFKAIKLTTLLLLVFCVQVKASLFAQNITLNLKNAPIKEVFLEIKKQSGYDILFNNEMLNQIGPLSVIVKNATVEEALNKSLQNLPLSYAIENKIIVIRRKALQKVDITGTVNDETGKGIPGVSVINENTKKAVATDDLGRFSIAGAIGDVIKVRMVGYEEYTFTIDARSNYPLSLEPTSFGLNDVVVVGYGTQKRANVTGAISQVDAKVLEDRPITAVSTGLQGTVTGLTTIGGSGQPGATNSALRIRGTGTTNNPNPFILIDGVPGDMNWINPDDIESVTVLKDAASSSIYGSRAANGVILVTTKKGKFNQKAIISYNGYYGFQKPTRLPKTLGSVEYMTLLGEAQANAGLPRSYTDAQIEVARNGSDPNYFANTNWTEALIKDYAPQQNHAISINGGSSDFNYYFSYARENQDGLIAGDQYKFAKNNARVKLSAVKLLNILDVDVNLGYLDRNQNQPASDTEGGGGVIYTAFTSSPLTPVRFTTGTWGYGGGSSNPLAVATDGGFNNFFSREFTSNITGTLHLLKGLDLKSQYGLIASSQRRRTFNRRIDYYNPVSNAIIYTTTPNNSLRDIATSTMLQNFSMQADYSLNLDKHHFKVLGGYQQETYLFDAFSASKTNLVSDDVPVLNIGSLNPTATGDAYQYALQSLFSRINYDYDGKYLFEFNLRYDGSSRYAPGHKWGIFPSVSVGWRFSEENFIKSQDQNWFSDGKIRASYGSLGNQYGADGPAYSEWYPYIKVLNSVGTMPIGNILTTGFAQTILSNPLLQWEKATMLNVGLDLAFFNNRLTFTGDWFNKKTVDIQLKVPQPDVIGLTVPDQNAGAISNKGYELSLGWNDKIGEFKYGFTAQFFDIKNKVTDLGGVPPTIGDRIRQVGNPLDAFYGYRTDGLAQEADFTKDAAGKYIPKFPIFSADAGKVAPGDLKYRDLNGDGVISADLDREVIGDAYPRYNYSFRLDAAYHNFDFSVFLQGVGEANGYITGAGIHAYNADAAFPQEVHLDRWTPQNTGGSYPRFVYKDTRNTARLAEYWLQDAAYLRVKNLQIGYTIPGNFLKKAHIDRLRLYASADNIFTDTNFFYAYDPETQASSGGLYPQVKTFIFGISLKLK